ncbi:MAG: glycosyltransferase family 4 protein [Methanotrichaceae archaeon]|nr:glycosyltransferase family 4 protein [Methanotrichaceae archaeon]
MDHKKLKIGIVSLSSGVLGDVVRIDQFCQQLEDFGYEVRLMNPYIESLPFTAGINNHKFRFATLIPKAWNFLSKLPVVNSYLIERLAYDILQTILSRALYQMAKQENLNLLQAETFLAADVALPIKRSLNLPMIFDLHSGLLTDEMRISAKLSPKFLHYMAKKEKKILRSSDHVIVTSKVMKDRLKSEYGMENLSIVPNAAIPWQGYRAPHGSPLNVIYSGIFAKWERIHDYLDAAKMIGNNGFNFYLTGDGYQKNELLAKISKEKIPVKYLGCLPRDKFREHMSNMHIGVAPWTKDEAFKYYSSTKTYEYLSMGVPVVCANAGEWAIAVKDNECGFVVPPEDPLAFAEAILAYKDKTIWEKHSVNGLKFITEKWSWNKILGGIMPIYESLKYYDNKINL